MTLKLIDMVKEMSKMKVDEVPLTLTLHHSDIKIEACCTNTNPSSFITRICAYNRLRYQVSIYRTIGHLVYYFTSF